MSKRAQILFRVPPDIKVAAQELLKGKMSLSQYLNQALKLLISEGDLGFLYITRISKAGTVFAPKERRSDLVVTSEGESEGETDDISKNYHPDSPLAHAHKALTDNIRASKPEQRELGIDPPGEWAALIASRVLRLELQPFSEWTMPQLARRIIEGVRPAWQHRPDLVVSAAQGVHVFWCSIGETEQLGRRKTKGGLALWTANRLLGELEYLAGRWADAEQERRRADNAARVLDDYQERADRFWDGTDEEQRAYLDAKKRELAEEVASGRLIR